MPVAAMTVMTDQVEGFSSRFRQPHVAVERLLTEIASQPAPTVAQRGDQVAIFAKVCPDSYSILCRLDLTLGL
jgi:hypothetical protein